MKKIIIVSFFFASYSAIAQNIKLAAGQKLTATATADMDISFIFPLKFNTVSTSECYVTKTDGAAYIATTTLTKIKATQAIEGNPDSFDSEIPGSKDSEFGKAVSSKIGKQHTISIDKNTGKAVELNKPAPDQNEYDNPMVGLVKGMNEGTEAGNTALYFFVMPANKKVGDRWVDSTITNESRVVNYYELADVGNGTATVNIKSNNANAIKVKTDNVFMEFNINISTTTVVMLDAATSIVKSRYTTGTMDGEAGLPGQMIPLSGNITSTTIFR